MLHGFQDEQHKTRRAASYADRYTTPAWRLGGRAYDTMMPSSNPNGGGGGGIVALSQLPENEVSQQQSLGIRGTAANFLLRNQSAFATATASSGTRNTLARIMDTEALV